MDYSALFSFSDLSLSDHLCIGFVRALQSGHFKWYYRAVKEAFGAPIINQPLSPDLRKQLVAFWRQNSIWHQLTRQL